MMGEQPRSEPLFYYFCLEDQIPEHHLLKRLDRHVDFSFVRERLRDAYSSGWWRKYGCTWRIAGLRG
jgi:transposase